MTGRTDLAVEVWETIPENERSIIKKEKKHGNVNTTKILIETKEEEKTFQKPRGTYITVEFPSLLESNARDEIEKAITEALRLLIKETKGTVLVAGLGNIGITADSIGPKTAARVLATRHLQGMFPRESGFSRLKSVAVIAPGVLGKTGIETGEILAGVVKTVKPAAVLVVDALAAGSVSRLFQTVQLCDSGICPGSGVKNSRREISEKTLGVPVIALGVPTVMDAGTLAEELSGKATETQTDLILTPKDADLLCEKISDLLAAALNRFLQPRADREWLESLL